MAVQARFWRIAARSDNAFPNNFVKIIAEQSVLKKLTNEYQYQSNNTAQ